MLVRRLARVMIAAPLVRDGIEAVRQPESHEDAARRGVDLVDSSVGLPRPLSESELTTVVRVHGAATALAGLALILGKAPRRAALVLAALTLPTALAQQPFSGDGGDTKRFWALVGSVGAALTVALDRQGRPSLGWRVSHARTQRSASHS